MHPCQHLHFDTTNILSLFMSEQNLNKISMGWGDWADEVSVLEVLPEDIWHCCNKINEKTLIYTILYQAWSKCKNIYTPFSLFTISTAGRIDSFLLK